VFKPVSDTVTISESINIVQTLDAFSDNVNVLSILNDISGSSLVNDSLSLSEELSQVFNKNIDNNISNVSITDTGSGILVDYAIDYFDEIYAGSSVIVF
jgi:hypothetical protein